MKSQISQYESQKCNMFHKYLPLPIVDGYTFSPVNSCRKVFKCRHCQVCIRITASNGTGENEVFTDYEFVSPIITHNHVRPQNPKDISTQQEEIIKIVSKGTSCLLPTDNLLEEYDQLKFNDGRRKTTIRRNINRTKKFVIEKKYEEIFNDKNEYVFEKKTNFIVFSSIKKLTMLRDRNFEQLCMDGTFSSAPLEYQQIYTIHGILGNGQSFALFHCLMTSRTEADYFELFTEINRLSVEILGKCLFDKHMSVMTDFENATLNALSRFECKLHGCNFHFGQCVWRAVQRIGLSSDYLPGSSVWKTVKRLIILSYLNSNLIRSDFNKIKNMVCLNELNWVKQLHEKMTELINYFEKTWINFYPLGLWSTFKEIVRTDNISEAYHSALVRRLRRQHPTLKHLLVRLAKEEELFIQKLNQMDCGKNHRSSVITNLARNLASGSTSIETYYEQMEKVLNNQMNELYFEDGQEEELDNLRINVGNDLDDGKDTQITEINTEEVEEMEEVEEVEETEETEKVTERKYKKKRKNKTNLVEVRSVMRGKH